MTKSTHAEAAGTCSQCDQPIWWNEAGGVTCPCGTISAQGAASWLELQKLMCQLKRKNRIVRTPEKRA
jgi:hypothetical protein